MFNREDGIVGVVSVLLGIFVIIYSATFHETTSMDPAGPGAVPIILAWCILIIGVIHIGGAYFAPRVKEDKKAKWAKEFEEAKPILRITLICIIYIFIIEYVGYLIATPLLIIGIMYSIKVRNIKNLLLTSVITTVVLFLIFGIVLKVRFPMGFLEAFLS